MERNFHYGRCGRHLPKFLSTAMIIIAQILVYISIKLSGDKSAKKERNRILSTFEKKHYTAFCFAIPQRFTIEITKTCNLKCRMCGQSFEDLDKTDLDPAAIEKIENIFPYLYDLALHGFGESLVSKEFLTILRQIPYWVPTRLVTNGIPMTEVIIDSIIDCHLNILSVSIDACDKDTYKKIRGVDKFDSVIDNIKLLQIRKQAKDSKYPSLRLGFVAMKSNIEQLPDFIRKAHSLGANGVDVGYLVAYSEDMQSESLYYHKELSNKFMLSAKELANQLSISIFLPPLFDLLKGESEEKEFFGFCPDPWEFSYLESNGDIIPCCIYRYALGNIKEQRFFSIWNNKKYRQFRKQIANIINRHEYCRHCIDFRHRSANSKIQHIRIIAPKDYKPSNPK